MNTIEEIEEPSSTNESSHQSEEEGIRTNELNSQEDMEFADRPLIPALHHVVLACLFEKPSDFEEHFDDLPLLFNYPAAKMIVGSYLNLRQNLPEVTLNAVIQEACSNTDAGKRASIHELSGKIQAVNVKADCGYVLSKIGGWLYKARYDSAMRQHLQALQEHRDVPSKQSYEAFELSKKDLIKVLSRESNSVKVEDAAHFLQKQLPPPVELIKGVMDRGNIALFGGGSKTRKTWATLNAGVSVATGRDFWKFPTVQGPVLYVNFELSPVRLQQRLKAVCQSLEATLPQEALSIMNMKGEASDPEKLIRKIIMDGRKKKYSLVIIDPLYSMLNGRVENSSEEMAQLMLMVGELAREVDCAVWITHHFSKGNQAAKASIDRVSGSGVLGRHPDSIITMTAHKEEDSYTVELDLRNHRDVEPFVVRWDYPLLNVDETLDPKELKQPKRKNTEKVNEKELIACLSETPISTSEWHDLLVEQEIDISKRTLERHAIKLKDRGRIMSERKGNALLWRTVDYDLLEK